jgi:glyoxylase-like metal-dependent hydrolase (beta-lactamase superfamily II)
MQVTKNVYVHTEFAGANVGYVNTEDGIVMIESPYRPSDAIKWRQEVESKGKIKYLINTEPHDDHTAGDFFFDVPIIAQEKNREYLMSADVNITLQTLALIDPCSEELVKGYKFRLPSITFSKNLNLYSGKHSFILINLPGHTPGETAIYLPEERVVFTGDNVTYRLHGFLHEANPIAWLESLKRIGEMDVDYIVPGHGDVCDKRYLSEQTVFIEGSLETVKEAINKGWTKEEAISKIPRFPSPYPFDEGTEDIAPSFMRPAISRIYDMLSQ